MNDDNIRRNMFFLSAMAEAVAAHPTSHLDALIAEAKARCIAKEKLATHQAPMIVSDDDDQD